MGLYDGPLAAACDRRCSEVAWREEVARRLERDRSRAGVAVAATPETLRAVTADSADSVVETGVARSGIGAKALAALSRLRSGSGSER